MKMNTYRLKMKFDITRAVLYIITIIFTVFCFIPFIIILSASLSNESDLITLGYGLIPRNPTLTSYSFIFANATFHGEGSNILKSYIVTISVTVLGTILSTIFTIFTAYPLSRKQFKYKKAISMYVFLTMLLNGGIVPWYMVTAQVLHLRDSIPALVIPYLLQAWNVFLLRNFFSTIPDSIEESSKIDGAGNYRIMTQIMIPLALPGIATIALFNALLYWNDWWLGLMLCMGNRVVPLQLYLTRIMSNIEFLKSSHGKIAASTAILPAETSRMAICILAIGPIVLAYPFFQKYFIQGLTVGAVKG